MGNFTLFHACAGNGALYRNNDQIADAGVSAVVPAEDAYAAYLLSTRVISYHEICLFLDHFAFSTISTSRHRLFLLSGRVSMIFTRSPGLACCFSSCAMSFAV